MAVLAESFFSGSSHFKLTLEYTYAQSISANSTDITYTLKFSSLDGYSGSGSAESIKGYINNALVGSTNSIGKNTTKTLGTQTITVPHNNDGTFPNTSYSASITSVWANIGSANVSGTLSGLPTIPRQATLKTAQDFTDEGNPTITYENKAGNSVTSLRAGIYNTAGTVAYAAYRDISKTGTSYTFNLTTAERNALRNAIPTNNSLQVKFYVTTVIGSSTYYSTLTKTMTLVNGNPTFSNFTFEDTNATTLALTGNNQYCVIGYSNIKATISTTNKATANKGATMSKYQLQIGNATPVNIAYSSSASVNGTISQAPSGTFVVYAIDSRNNSTPVTKLAAEVKNYSKLQINKTSSNIVRNNNGIGTGATLTLSGTFWNNSFGSVTNTIKSVTYRLKKTTSSTWSDGTTSITPTVSGNNFTFSGLIAGDESTTWNINDSYNVQITITDELSTATVDLILNSGTPTMALAQGGVAIKQKFDTSKSAALQVAGNVFASNTIVDMGSNTNGSYIKWDNGLMVCYKTIQGTVDITTSTMGGTMYYGAVSMGATPATFTSRPTIIASANNQVGTQCFLMGQANGGNGSATSFGQQSLGRTNSRTALAYVIDVMAIGMWK